MNINFDNSGVKPNSNVDRVTTSNSGSHVKETNSKGVFALDISGIVMDNTAYDGHGKTAEDVMQEAGQVDIATQKNYMAVMSNTMSGEDFARLQKEGYHPGDTDIETVVTIVDEIKASLARGGNNIIGYTDDLDVETLTQITGSVSFANELIKQFKENDIPVTRENVEDATKACKMAVQLDDLSDGIKKYMLRNHKEPTLDNLYKARHSGAADANRQGKGYYQDDTGYYAKKAEDYNWQQLRPQMEKVIESAGLTVSDETLTGAKWLIEKGMPLTGQSLRDFYELSNLELPDTMEEAVKAAVTAIANGRKAGYASLSDHRTDIKKALDYIDDVQDISEEAVDKTVSEGKPLNINNLKAAQLQISAGIQVSAGMEAYTVSVSGRRQLEEVRLQMTFQANLQLIRSGFSIDTAELEQLVEALKTAEQQRQQVLFGGGDAENVSGRPGLYADTLAKVRELPYMPAALLGRFTLQSAAFSGIVSVSTRSSFTLEAVHAEGSALRAAYEKAGESYETLMTSPRADMGDSIKKAFRNVDDILKNMEMEISDMNRRAVRILGYNRMEISKENLTAVKETDLMIRSVTDRMTPASTLQMIRDGMNPLSMDMEELTAYLDSNERTPQHGMEKYSEYLHRLEKNNEITSQERDSYIGIYRLFRQLDKTDGAAIGTLISQGMEPTVKNLLSAMRSNKKHGMDVTVNDLFGGITSADQEKSISRQIESAYTSRDMSYYKKLASDIFDRLDSSRFPAQAAGDMTLEELSAMIREQKTEESSLSDYQKQQMSTMREAAMAEEAVVKDLLEFDQPITVNNLLAAGLLMKERGKLADRLREMASKIGEERAFESAVRDLHENMKDEVSAKEAYDKLDQTFTNIIEEFVYGQDAGDKIDIKEINNMYKQISLSRSLAKEENYEVPVDIDGEMTSINLRIIRNGNETGKVTASMQTVTYGKVMARFHMTNHIQEGENTPEYQMAGYAVCDNAEGLKILEQSKEQLKKAFKQSDINISSMDFVYNRELDLSAALRADEMKKEEGTVEEKGREQEISTRKLYEIAKIFISYIQKGEGF